MTMTITIMMMTTRTTTMRTPATAPPAIAPMFTGPTETKQLLQWAELCIHRNSKQRHKEHGVQHFSARNLRGIVIGRLMLWLLLLMLQLYLAQ